MIQTNGRKTTTTPVVEVSLDFDTYTNGELEAAEELVGGNIHELTIGVRFPPQKVINALLLVTLRRTRPEATPDEVKAMDGKAWAIAKIDPLPGRAEASEPNASPESAPTTA